MIKLDLLRKILLVGQIHRIFSISLEVEVSVVVEVDKEIWEIFNQFSKICLEVVWGVEREIEARRLQMINQKISQLNTIWTLTNQSMEQQRYL